VGGGGKEVKRVEVGDGGFTKGEGATLALMSKREATEAAVSQPTPVKVQTVCVCVCFEKGVQGR